MHMQRAAAALARPGSITSHPFFCNTRTVASFRRAKLMFAMHRPETPRDAAARLRPATSCRNKRRKTASRSRAPGPPPRAAAPGEIRAAPTSRFKPLAWYRYSSAPAISRFRRDGSSLRKTSQRRNRSRHGRRILVFDFGPRRFHQPSILHARRTGCLASPARQAKIDVLDVGRADRRAARQPAPFDRCGRAANPFPRAARDRWGRRSGTARNARSGRDRIVAVYRIAYGMR